MHALPSQRHLKKCIQDDCQPRHQVNDPALSYMSLSCPRQPGDLSTTQRANTPTIQHPSAPGRYRSTSATACHHLLTRRSHRHTLVHHARANNMHTTSFNVCQHSQHMASKGCHIWCSLAPANASRRIHSHSTPVTYNDNGAPQRPLRPTRTHAQRTARSRATSRIIRK